MFKNKRTMWIAFIVLILILLTLVGYYFYKKSKSNNDGVLTPEERVDILKNIAPKNTAPIPEPQRAKALKQLVPETTKKPMTAENRLNILNSLNKQ